MFDTAFQGTIIRNQPTYRPRPDTMPGYHKFTKGTYDAFVAHSALEAIAWRAREAAPDEMIGHLVGRPFRDAKGSYAVVTEAIVAESARCGPATVQTSFDDETGLLDTLLANHPLAERLGWFHSHPFPMAKYSATDRENQRFWSEPYQLGLLAYFDRDKSVSIIGFRGPESEAIHPPYTASGNACPNHVPTFRALPETETREPMPRTAKRTRRTKRRRPSHALLALAVGVIWPIVFLIGVWMIVQAIQEGRVSPVHPIAVAKDEEASAAQSSSPVPAEAATSEVSKVPTPTAPVVQTNPKAPPAEH
ncbi:MAG TPA: Mov34/MPN/PAD-1 family protein [Gemmataceae bacterium]|jgi:proteasome lid subunit RPN8/RPN11